MLSRLALFLGALVLVAGCGGNGSTQTGQASATTATTTAAVFPPASTTPPKPSASIASLVPPTSAELAAGRRLFQENLQPAGCSFCHSLRAAANSSGASGVNLNAELQEPDTRKFTDAQLAQRVHEWIGDAYCLDPTDVTRCMPRKIFTGRDADLVAVFVALCGRTPRMPGCQPVAGGLSGEVGTGMKLFQTETCVGCHFFAVACFNCPSSSAGPSLYGLAGSKVKLADGTTVTADDAYLTQSIAAPDAKIVSGYPSGLMSSRVAQLGLTSAQIHALVTYIKTLKR